MVPRPSLRAALLCLTMTACSGAEAGTEGESGEVCEDLRDAAPGEALSVRIRNDGAEPLFLEIGRPAGDGYFNTRPFELFEVASATLLDLGGVCSASFSCEELIDGNPICGACDPGPPFEPRPIKIAAGATYSPPAWDGRAWTDATIPGACVDPACAMFPDGGACQRQVEISGELKVSARAGRSIACASGTCECEPGPEGWCMVDGQGTIDASAVEAEITYPGTQTVDLVFP
ncbi:MAG: hypothetical protein H6710_09575 [Myxococcales bacterium]|nr:hypothetical protein [Myxococcales bacterium]MCB9700689.1 hypothetical protein [Myxococcales bacterium]